MEQFPTPPNNAEAAAETPKHRIIELPEAGYDVPEGERTFEIAEVMACIVQLDGVDPADLKLLTERKNRHGVVIALTIKLNPQKAQEKFKDTVEYLFQLKGEKRPTFASDTTVIDRSYEMGAESFAKFKDGAWVKV